MSVEQQIFGEDSPVFIDGLPNPNIVQVLITKSSVFPPRIRIQGRDCPTLVPFKNHHVVEKTVGPTPQTTERSAAPTFKPTDFSPLPQTEISHPITDWLYHDYQNGRREAFTDLLQSSAHVTGSDNIRLRTGQNLTESGTESLAGFLIELSNQKPLYYSSEHLRAIVHNPNDGTIIFWLTNQNGHDMFDVHHLIDLAYNCTPILESDLPIPTQLDSSNL